MFKYYNPNPTGKQVGDCVIRGISRVTGKSWDDTYIEICLMGYELKDMPSANHVWESYLASNGFVRGMIKDSCPSGSHVIAVENGDYYDAWGSGNEVPIYYWRKEQ